MQSYPKVHWALDDFYSEPNQYTEDSAYDQVSSQ
jgi:hypothetical protein